MHYVKSEEWFNRACKVIPGGVNSPVRAFGAVGGTPPFAQRGKGSHLWDEDGNEYIDFVASWGALVLGHAHPEVVEACRKALENGLSFGAATAREVLLAELICSSIPSLEKIRLVSSGTEATMTAIRLARGFTGRSKILKFEGCYHGHSDALLVKAGSGLLTFGRPSSDGVPTQIANETLIAPYNDLESVEEIFASHGKEIACVIVEPIAANMGVVSPKSDFLKKLQALCRQHNTVFIIDEVITGFRFHFGGYQSLCDIHPDLTCLGKIIGGGMPIGAVGGKQEIMNLLAPLGPVYQAGTLSGNPISTAAGLATLQVLQSTNPYPSLKEITSRLKDGILELAKKNGVPMTVNQEGSMMTPFFSTSKVGNFEEVMQSNKEEYKAFFHGCLSKGVFPPPSPFEAWFISAAHTAQDIEKTLSIIQIALEGISSQPQAQLQT